MHKPEPAQENEMPKILLDFDIKTDHLILSRKLDIKINCRLVDFVVPTHLTVKNKRKKKKSINTCKINKKEMRKMKLTMILIQK